jgi:putative restriction endonuclease
LIWPLLVEAGRRRESVTYGALAPAIHTNALSVRYALGPIQSYCLENRLAPLTAVVVGKSSRRPGDGFVAWDADDIEAALEAVRLQNWDLVGNPFQGFGPDDDEGSFADTILDQPAARGDVFPRVRDRGVAQRIFRAALLKAYGQCVFCGLSFPAALEAAHILEWRLCSDEEKLDVRNGLLLCATHHRLFDDNTLTLSEGLTVLYCDPLEIEGPYTKTDRRLSVKLHERAIRLPAQPAWAPDASFIRRRYDAKAAERSTAVDA